MGKVTKEEILAAETELEELTQQLEAFEADKIAATTAKEEVSVLGSNPTNSNSNDGGQEGLGRILRIGALHLHCHLLITHACIATSSIALITLVANTRPPLRAKSFQPLDDRSFFPLYFTPTLTLAHPQADAAVVAGKAATKGAEGTAAAAKAISDALRDKIKGTATNLEGKLAAVRPHPNAYPYPLRLADVRLFLAFVHGGMARSNLIGVQTTPFVRCNL
jgi:hypothetical protein